MSRLLREGDVVECVSNTNRRQQLTIGIPYKIIGVMDAGYRCYVINDKGIKAMFYTQRFILVDEPEKTKVNNNMPLYDGQTVTYRWKRETETREAVIAVEGKSNKMVYICQNQHPGARAENKHGYKYSYLLGVLARKKNMIEQYSILPRRQ